MRRIQPWPPFVHTTASCGSAIENILPVPIFGIPPSKIHHLLTHQQLSELRETCTLDIFDMLKPAVASICQRYGWLWLHYSKHSATFPARCMEPCLYGEEVMTLTSLKVTAKVWVSPKRLSPSYLAFPIRVCIRSGRARSTPINRPDRLQVGLPNDSDRPD